MSKSHPLPRTFASRPFLVGEAHDAGVTRSRLRSAWLDRSFWGIRNARPLDDLRSACEAMAVRMPQHAVFSHITAALVHGIPVPWQFASVLPLHIAFPAPSRAPHAAHIRGHQLILRDEDIVVAAGIQVTSAERTWFDLAVMLPLHDLVAAGDGVIHWRAPMTSVVDLAHIVETTPAHRARRKRTDALLRLNNRSESPPESVLRVILVDAGAPAIRVNHAVTDRFGEFVGRTDLIIDEWKLILEYQGDYHRRTKGQWRADMTRRSRLEAEGWRVIELNADDLRDPAELIARILRRVGQPV